MNKNHESETIEATENEQAAANTAQPACNESEFKVTVRKLEMPVRPRGVLAE